MTAQVLSNLLTSSVLLRMQFGVPFLIKCSEKEREEVCDDENGTHRERERES